MTATSVRPPERPNLDATYRQLSSDDDWQQSLQLRIACNDTDEVGYETFAARKLASDRATAEAGHGGWFGAFLDGRLVAQMGLFKASSGLARFQTVETHPELRGRGLAGTLVHHTSRHGFDELGARTLVMVADPEYLAIRIYRSVGFAATETQLQAELQPPT
jgi:RimJ/RimL family protein N-acetyltransferase